MAFNEYEFRIPTRQQSNTDGGVWKSYEDAAKAGYGNIKTHGEFERRGGLEEYGTYQAYLDAMYAKYVTGLSTESGATSAATGVPEPTLQPVAVPSTPTDTGTGGGATGATTGGATSGNYVTVTKDPNGQVTSVLNSDGTPGFINTNNFDDPPTAPSSTGGDGSEGKSDITQDPEYIKLKEEIAALQAAMKLMGTGSGSGGSVNAISYGDYLKNYGVDTKKAYSEAVRQANSDYYRTLMTYGKNAEALAGNGLTGGGVSDYGNAAAYAARQGAVATAGAAKLETDAKQAASYAEYLQQAQAQARAEEAQMNANRNNFIMSLMSYGVTDPEQIESLARQSGYFSEDQLAEFVKFAEDYSTTAGAANQADADALYSELVAGGMAPDAAKAQVVQKYGDDIAQTAQDNVAKITTTHDNAGVDTMLTGNYSPFNEENSYTVDYFKKQVAAGAISEEEAQKQIDKIEQANLKWIEGQLSDANNAYKVDAILAQFGMDAKYADASDEEKITAATDAVNAKVRELVVSGELSEEKAAGYYRDFFEANWEKLSKEKDSLKYINSIANIKEIIGYMDSSEEVYNEILDKIILNSTISVFAPGNFMQVLFDNGSGIKINLKPCDKKEIDGESIISNYTIKGDGVSSFYAEDVDITLYSNGCIMLGDDGHIIKGVNDFYTYGAFQKEGPKDENEIIYDLICRWCSKKT